MSEIQTQTFKGARYVPLFPDPIQWSADRTYEAITVVQHNAFTYLSKRPVPVGVEITNTEFWLLWADPNAQMEELRQIFMQYVGEVNDLSGTVDDLVQELAAEIEARKLDVKKAHVFDTVADMKAGANLSDGAICHTNGFHTSGDGGAAWYVISSTGTANEMDVIACGDLFAILVYDKKHIIPEQFGAYGLNDYQQAIQYDDTNVFDYLFTDVVDHNSVIVLSNKYYSVTKGFNISKRNVHIVSNARGEYLPSIIFNAVDIVGFSVSSYSFTLLGVQLRTADDIADYPKNALLSFNVASNDIDATIKNCAFSRCGIAINVVGRNVDIQNCLFSTIRNYTGTVFNGASGAICINNANNNEAIRGIIIQNSHFHQVITKCVNDLVTNYTTEHVVFISNNYFDAIQQVFEGTGDSVIIDSNYIEGFVAATTLININRIINNDKTVRISNNFITGSYRTLLNITNSCILVLVDNNCESSYESSGNIINFTPNDNVIMILSIIGNLFNYKHTSGYLIVFNTTYYRGLMSNNVIKASLTNYNEPATVTFNNVTV